MTAEPLKCSNERDLVDEALGQTRWARVQEVEEKKNASGAFVFTVVSKRCSLEEWMSFHLKYAVTW